MSLVSSSSFITFIVYMNECLHIVETMSISTPVFLETSFIICSISITLQLLRYRIP